jgi:hypothetical protein
VCGREWTVIDDGHVPAKLGREARHGCGIGACAADEESDGRHHNLERHFDCPDLTYDSAPSGGESLLKSLVSEIWTW